MTPRREVVVIVETQNAYPEMRSTFPARLQTSTHRYIAAKPEHCFRGFAGERPLVHGEKPRGRDLDNPWMNVPVARALLREKHGMAITLTLYRAGEATTCALIRGVGGHPAAIIRALRVLENLEVLYRVRTNHGRKVVVNRLTVKGVHLVETPVHRWPRILRHWDLCSANNGQSLR